MAYDEQHRATLDSDRMSRPYTARCLCGWEGQEEKSQLSAMKHFSEHLVTVQRQEVAEIVTDWVDLDSDTSAQLAASIIRYLTPKYTGPAGSAHGAPDWRED